MPYSLNPPSFPEAVVKAISLEVARLSLHFDRRTEVIHESRDSMFVAAHFDSSHIRGNVSPGFAQCTAVSGLLPY